MRRFTERCCCIRTGDRNAGGFYESPLSKYSNGVEEVQSRRQCQLWEMILAYSTWGKYAMYFHSMGGTLWSVFFTPFCSVVALADVLTEVTGRLGSLWRAAVSPDAIASTFGTHNALSVSTFGCFFDFYLVKSYRDNSLMAVISFGRAML